MNWLLERCVKMEVIIDKTLLKHIPKIYYKQCSICGRDVIPDNDFVYTKHKQGETLVHKSCYESLIRRSKK